MSDELQKSRGTLSSTSFEVVRKRKHWLLTAGLLVGLTVLGWWTHRTIVASLEQDVANELTTILRSDVAALETWLKAQRANAEVLAAWPEVQSDALELLQLARQSDDPQALAASPPLARLRRTLAHPLEAYKYDGFGIITLSGEIIGSQHDKMVGLRVPSEQMRFIDRVAKGQTAISHPFLGTSVKKEAAEQKVPLMFVAAPLRDQQNKVVGALGLRIPPEEEFTQILMVARSGETGESYAFDEQGRLLSHSRFAETLRKLKLIEPEEEAILNLDLRDPGVDLTRGGQPQGPREGMSLTHLAAQAIAARRRGDHEIGVNVEGYRDYRGVKVVGAWRWLHDYDFGVATEADYAEAFSTSRAVLPIFWLVFGFVALGALAVVLITRTADRLRGRLRRADRRIERLGSYSLNEKLGEGGMGEVYRATHAMLRRPTAVKLLRAENSNEAAIQRFEREVQLTSQLTHPNTIAIFDYGRNPDGVFYYAMEYIEGIDLKRVVESEGPQPESRVIHILQQVCGSLDEAHALGLVHRDIKPANIMLCHRGREYDVVKVLDFGLVKNFQSQEETELTAANSIIGTPMFLSPEAILTQDLDARSDLYSVGAVAFYLLTGEHLFDGEAPMQIMYHHANTEPDSPSQRLGRTINPELEQLILRCLAKSPDDRPQSAAEIVAALSACASVSPWTMSEAQDRWERESASTTTSASPYDRTLSSDGG